MLKFFQPNPNPNTLEEAIHGFLQGRDFPWSVYFERNWPAPFYILEPELQGHCCPMCNSAQQVGPDRPHYYNCGRCGFLGAHPMFHPNPSEKEKELIRSFERSHFPNLRKGYEG